MAAIAPYPARSDFNGQTISQREPDAFNFSRPNFQEVCGRERYVDIMSLCFFFDTFTANASL